MNYRIRLGSALCLLGCFLSFPSLARGDNWPHWRGDSGNGLSLTAHPPTRWSDKLNVKWKVEIPGSSSGSPIVWEDRVFVVTAESTSAGGQSVPDLELQFKLLCFERNTGKKMWEQTAVVAKPHEGTHATNGFASASPCTDGQHVYAHFGSRGLFCYTLSGELKWSRTDFPPMTMRSGFGEGSSPTLAGDKILVPWDHEEQSFLYALNKTSGETAWQVKRDEPSCWATPLVVTYQGKQQIIMNGQTAVRCYDLETGQELWRCGGQTERPAASAVTQGDMVFVGSGFRGSFLGAFRLGGSGDIQSSTHVVWTLNSDTPDIASPLLSGGRLYFYKGKTGQLSCVDAATGAPHFEAARVLGTDTTYASPIAAGGYIYLTGRSGTTMVIRDGEKLEIVSKNSVGETVDATPAPVDNQLFIRGEKHLFCIQE
jgi:outer membrane protein assembly factor BamB